MEQVLRKAVKNRDIVELCRAFFDVDLEGKQGQQDIVEAVAFDDKKRVIITAPTRYGKTFSVALGVAIYLVLHKDKTVNEIAPKMKQSKKFRSYLVDFILSCPPLRDRLDVDATGEERLRKEVSKKRMTFRDGNEVQILTAGGSDLGQSLMGEGGDLNVLDESCDIDSEVYRKRISRMLGDSATSKLVEIGNPWRKDNHFYQHWKEYRDRPDGKRIHIDHNQAIREGRLSESFVEEQRNELTETEFQILYEARFPDSVEGGLIKHSWVEEAKKREPFSFESDTKVVGVDVAEKGENKTVTTTTYQEDNRVRVTDYDVWQGVETMDTVALLDDNLLGHESLNVDAIGVGSGVASRLRELDYHVTPVKVSKSPRTQKDRFLNQKALYYWRLRSLFQDGRITLEGEVPGELVEQLTAIRYEITSSGKIKILDPETGSPDFADSLMLACCRTTTTAETGSGSVQTGGVSLV